MPNTSLTDLLKIGDIAKVTGLTLRTLRYYEELELIVPDSRTKGNFRLYHPKILNKLNFIDSLKKLDFTLEEIKDLLGPISKTPLSDKEIIDHTIYVMDLKQKKITERLQDLKRMDADVKNAFHMLQECLVCKQLQPDVNCNPDCDHKQYHIE